MHRTIVFITGGATLALQLIASRIMAPFFGVSLFIWTGILSITLLCLALGYFAGGVYCRKARPERIAAMYFVIPAASCLSLVISALAYPLVLGPLARLSLVGGTFAASILLLALPLVAMSALNPLLVAIERPRDGAEGDAGAGWVFFISTMGSVAGVIVAAFCFIPYVSNQHSVLAIAAALGGLSLWGVGASPALPRRVRVGTAAAAAAGVLAALLVATLHPAAQPVQTGRDLDNETWTVLASYPSSFGSLKVAETPRYDGESLRVMINDGIIQDGIQADGRSAFVFSHLLEAGAANLVPRARRVLVLGLGTGVIPEAFARRGAKVDVVEINERMLAVAKSHFAYRPGPETRVFQEDARTFVQGCTPRYDIVFIDLFAGDGIPEHLMTREFFSHVRACMNAAGVLAMNSFIDEEYDLYRHMLSTMASTFGRLAFIREERSAGTRYGNAFIFASGVPAGLEPLRALDIDPERVPADILASIRRSMTSLQMLTPASPLLAGVPAATDENNLASVHAAPVQLAYRRRTIESIPDFILAN